MSDMRLPTTHRAVERTMYQMMHQMIQRIMQRMKHATTRSLAPRTIGICLLALGASLAIPGAALIAQTVTPDAGARAAARADEPRVRPLERESYRLSVDDVAVGTTRQVTGLEAVTPQGSAPAGGQVTLTVPMDSAGLRRMYVWRKLVIDRGPREAGRVVELTALDRTGQVLRRYTLRGAYLREAILPALNGARGAAARLVIAYEQAELR